MTGIIKINNLMKMLGSLHPMTVFSIGFPPSTAFFSPPTWGENILSCFSSTFLIKLVCCQIPKLLLPKMSSRSNPNFFTQESTHLFCQRPDNNVLRSCEIYNYTNLPWEVPVSKMHEYGSILIRLTCGHWNLNFMDFNVSWNIILLLIFFPNHLKT